MLRLLLCRHGQSTPDLEPRCIEGSGDFPLTDLGRRQGQALAAWLAARYQIDEIVSSPLLRAQEVARLVSAATGAPVRLEPRLAERSSGRLAGLTPDEADRAFPVRHPTPVYHKPPGGESYLDQFRRVAEWYFPLAGNPALDGRTLLAVAHGGTLTCLLNAALGLPPQSSAGFACADTGLHELHLFPDGGVRLVKLNHTAHLDGLV